jgi:sodium-dependent dicarboxylate transporter 2/3/5
MWFDPISTLLFTLGFAKVIFDRLGMQKGERYPAMVVIGIAFSISIAFGMTPISHPLPLLALGVYREITGSSINFVTYMALGIPVGLVCFAGMLAILRFVVNPDMKKITDADLDALFGGRPEPMKKREKMTVTVAIFVFGCWLLAGFLNVFAANSALAVFFGRITTLSPAIVGVALLSMLHADGEPLMSFEKGMRNGIDWTSVVLLSALFMLGNGLVEPTTGFSASIVGVMGPFIKSDLSSFAIMFVIMLVITLLTNVLNNIPVVMLMLSVCIPLASTLDMSPMSITLLITIVGEMAFATPSAFPTITIIYGDDWTQPKMIFRCGVIVMLWCLLVMTALGYPLAKMMFA